MAETGKTQAHNKHRPTDPGDEIVITGMSGRFPKSRNVDILRENLMKKKDLIGIHNLRWTLEHVEIPERHGIISDTDKFDSQYFGIPYKEVFYMDPMGRMLLEHTYEAIVDAGVNPAKLRGTKTAVIFGLCYSETELKWIYAQDMEIKCGITGCSKAMMANRVSQWLGVRGPSYTVDTACSSSLFAINQAVELMRRGECDAAIVGGANLCLHPYMSLHFARLGVLSKDGTCKSFDEKADGYVRSETVSVIFLQKAKIANRIYATIIHSKTNCDGYKPEGITYPSTELQGMLLEEFYAECGLPPTILSFLEGHATGTTVGDPEELAAIDKVLCTGRTTPLKVGGVKSNLGHAEPASAMCSIAKIIIAMETGVIPPNINLKQLRKGIECFEKGRVQIITEPTPWELGYVGINSFGFGGGNGHVLLKSNPKDKISGAKATDELPRIVTVSGRTEEAVLSLLNSVETAACDVEYISLLLKAHTERMIGHQYRGYMICRTNALKGSVKEIAELVGVNRPACFVFSGLGSQWPGMGTALMKFNVFYEAMQKCNTALKPHNIDLINIITNKEKTLLNNTVNSFVGTAAIQIGLVDLLRAMDIVPDYIIGHSLGELGCAYADGCITLEQTILSAYYIGLACTEAKTIRGAMAEISLGCAEVKNICPADIDVACRNSPRSCTISGPAQSVKAFIATLQTPRVSAKEIPCCHIAHHSRYVADIRPILLKYLKKVISKPKARSGKWLSTSVLQNDWSLPGTKMSSAEYHANSFLSSVLFEETASSISKSALMIEIAPHGVLQEVLEQWFRTDGTIAPLSQRENDSNDDYFLHALGKLYNAGLDIRIANIYPPVEFPVSRGTPMISPHIKWNHSEDWYVTSYVKDKIESGYKFISVDLSDENFEYMYGHSIDGRLLLPAMGYLFLIWDTYSKMQGTFSTVVPVVFEDIKFERATSIPKHGVVGLYVIIQKGTGSFEIMEGTATVVTGKIRPLTDPSEESIPSEYFPEIDVEEVLTKKDFYKELRLRGYSYSGTFCGVHSASITGSKGHLMWLKNWTTFLDTMLQIQLLGYDTRQLFVPTEIQKIVIDAALHLEILSELPKANTVLPVYYYKDFGIVKSGGIEIHNVHAHAISRRKPPSVPVLEEYGFHANCDEQEVSLQQMIRFSVHVALENELVTMMRVIEVVDDDDAVTEEEIFSTLLAAAYDDLPLMQATISLVAKSDRFNNESLPGNVIIVDKDQVPSDGSIQMICGYNLLSERKKSSLPKLLLALKSRCFILSRESAVNNETFSHVQKHKLDVIMKKKFGTETFLLLKKRGKLPDRVEVVHVDSNKFDWLEKLQAILSEITEKGYNENMSLILVGEGDPECGLLGLSNCIRREPGGHYVRTFVIQDENAPKFSLTDPLYAKQLDLDMAVNVLQPGCVWGTYRHLPLPVRQKKPFHSAFALQTLRADLSSFCWMQGPITPELTTDDTVRIAYVAMNFKDVMIATGRLPVESVTLDRRDYDYALGFEYSGVTTNGRRIMGLKNNCGISSMCQPEYWCTWDVPDFLTLEEAATIPCVYATSYYALFLIANLTKDEKVLIHGGSGGVGQAAIHLALSTGCEVFTTVGTPDKRRFIRETFPSIDNDHIGNSRDTSFEQMVLGETNGRGVDVLLNSLTEEKLRASVRCLAPGGRFVEIGKYDLQANHTIGMKPFLKEISYHGAMLERFFYLSRGEKDILHKVVETGLQQGIIKPLSRVCFKRDEVEAAYRYMAAGKHIGKVLIKMHDTEKDITSPIHAYPRYCCSEDSSYVIIGGLGGLGLELADWLYLRGAQKLILVSRGGVKNGYQKFRINGWKSNGIKVLVISGVDASTHEGCEFILKSAEKEGPVDGIFNLAALLKDNLCAKQTVKDFEDSVRPKAWITKRLDELSRKLCPRLRHFVVFSSVSCGRGTPGQSNYGLGNSVMERICERRAAEGLPAVAIEWGAVGEVGLVADMQEENKQIVIGGTLQQKLSSCLQELDGFLMQNKPIVSSMVVAEKRASSGRAATPLEAVLDIMGLNNVKGISLQTSLPELGMDSMMGVEIKQTLERDFEIFLNARDIRNLTFMKIMELSNEKLKEKNEMEKKPLKHTKDMVGFGHLIRMMGTTFASPTICVELPVGEVESKREIFLLPGLEGNAAVFSQIVPHLKHPTTCLQLGIQDADTVQDLAQLFLPHLLERSKNRKDFTIVGYSFGALVAIELARAMEAKGFTGQLILIDGSPDYLKQATVQLAPSQTVDELEMMLIVGFMSLLHPPFIENIITDMTKCKTWDERVDAFFRLLPSEAMEISKEEAKTMTTVIYKRVLMIEKFDVSQLKPLQVPITLLKPTQAILRDVDADYGLEKITSGEVKVHEIEGNHVTIWESKDTVALINGEAIEDSKITTTEATEKTITPKI